MNWAWRKKLIEDLIKENPDYTIKDYLEIVAEIESIESATNKLLNIEPEPNSPELHFTDNTATVWLSQRKIVVGSRDGLSKLVGETEYHRSNHSIY